MPNILGQTSQRFESGSKGPATVSSGRGDYGGVSYGTYQYSSRGGFNSSVAEFIKRSSFANRFEGILPGTPEYTEIWKDICSTNLEQFGHEQHEYIKSRYYDVAIIKLRRLGLSPETFCFGLKELIWSSAVQFGATGCYRIFMKAGVTPNHSNLEIIDLVYKEKNKVGVYFSKSSKRVQESVLNRFAHERKLNIKDCS